MSFIAWPPGAHLRRNGEQSGSREIRKNRSGPPGRAMSRGFPFPPRADYSPVLAFHAELHNSAGFCTGRSDVQCVTQREGKSPVPFSKLETYPGGWGFYPLSILCLIRSAKITASVMIEFRAGDGRWRHRSTLESRRFFGCPLGVLPAEGGKSGVNDPMGISNRIY